MSIEELWNQAMRETEIVQMPIKRLMTFDSTQFSYVLLSESKVNIGDSIVLQDLVSSEEVRYTLVSPKEVDPTRGKISGVSPIGKAIIGKGQGEIVEVTVPAGRLRYQIKQIEH